MKPIEKVEPYRISRLSPDIIEENVLDIIHAGFCYFSGEPLTIIQRSESDVQIILTSGKDLQYSTFCLAIKGDPEGLKLCSESSREHARVIFEENIQEPYSYFCHAGLICFAFPVVIEGKTLAVFLSGKRWDPVYAGGPEKRIERLEQLIPNIKIKKLDEKLSDVPTIDPTEKEIVRKSLDTVVDHVTKLAEDHVQSIKGLRQRQFLDELRQIFTYKSVSDIENPKKDIEDLNIVMNGIIQRIIEFSDLKFILLFANLSTDKLDEKEMKHLPLAAYAGELKHNPDNLRLDMTNILDMFNEATLITPEMDNKEKYDRKKLEEVLISNLRPLNNVSANQLSLDDVFCVFFELADKSPAVIVLGPRIIPVNEYWINLSARDAEFYKLFTTQLSLWNHNSSLLTQLQTQVEYLQDFIKRTGHELMGPLQGVRSEIGYSLELFDERYGGRDKQYSEDEQIRTYIEAADEMAVSINNKLNNFRIIANITSGKKIDYQFQSHPIGRLVDKSAIQFRRKAFERGIKIVVHPDVHLGNVILDWDKMSSVFTNLIDNAVKYSFANKTIDIHGKKYEDYVEVTISDYGHGISESERERIFEAGYRIQIQDQLRAIDGMGLGLAIVKEIVINHGGEVWAECPEIDGRRDLQGRVVKFIVRLPLTQSGG